MRKLFRDHLPYPSGPCPPIEAAPHRNFKSRLPRLATRDEPAANSGQPPAQNMRNEFDWMLVPSLVVGLLASLAYIAWFASLHLSGLLSAETGQTGLAAAAGASLVLGLQATRVLLDFEHLNLGRLSCCLITLTIGAIVFLLILDAIALFPM